MIPGPSPQRTALSTFDPAHFGVANSELLRHQTELAKLEGIYGSIQAPALKVNDSITAIGMSSKEAAKIEEDLNEKVKASIAANTKYKAEMDKFNASLRNVTTAGRGYSGVLDDMNGNTLEAIRFGLQHHASVADLARVYGVEEAAVVGLPHEDFGEGVTAFLVTKPGAQLTETGVLEALRDRLARFKQPKRVIFVKQLPRNTMGKVQKSALREEYAKLY